jgi:hypothetical protein
MGFLPRPARAILIFLLVFQAIVSPVVSWNPRAEASSRSQSDDSSTSDAGSEIIINALRQGAGDPRIRNAQAKIEEGLSEFERAGDNDAPSKNFDFYHLGKQTLEQVIISEGMLEVKQVVDSRSLSDIYISNPVVGFDIEKVSVQIEKVKSQFSFEFPTQKGRALRHTFSGFNIVAHTQDKELTVLLDASGKIFAVDMGYFKKRGFQGPMPVFEIGEVPEGVSADDLKVSFLTRALKPGDISALRSTKGAVFPQDKDMNKLIFTAGDAMIYRDTDGGRQYLGLYDRQVILSKVFSGIATLAYNAYAIAPGRYSPQVREEAVTLATDGNVKTEIDRAGSSFNDPTLRTALTVLGEDSVKGLFLRAAAIKNRMQSPRDKFLFEEWLADAKPFYDVAQARIAKNTDGSSALQEQVAAGDLGASYKDLQEELSIKGHTLRQKFYRLMTPSRVKLLGAVAAGGAAAAGAVQLMGGAQVAWSLFLSSLLSTATVLSNDQYRWTLLKSMTTQAIFIVTPIVVGLATAKDKSFQFLKPYASLVVRGVSYGILPFYNLISHVGMKNALNTLKGSLSPLHSQGGLNPWNRIQPESPLGQQIGLKEPIFLGINSLGDKKGEQVDAQGKALDIIARGRNQAQQTAGLLANIVVSMKRGIDLPTLIATQNAIIDGKDVATVVNDPKFHSDRARLAWELSRYMVKSKPLGASFDPSEIPAEDLLKFHQFANETADRLEKFERDHPRLSKLRDRTRGAYQRFLKGAVEFGKEEREFLSNVDPAEFPQRQFWSEYVLSQFVGLQAGLIGPRADLNHPEKLVAQEGAALWTNRQHLSELFDNVRSNHTSLGSKMLVFQQKPEVRDDRYDPHEWITKRSVENPENLIQGVWSWAKGTFNLPKSDIGGTFLRAFSKRLMTLQLNYVMFMAIRMTVGGQFLWPATAAFLFFQIWGPFSYSFAWPIGQTGNKIYEERFDGLNKRFDLVKTRLSQGLRFGDERLIQEGYEELFMMYREEGARLPEEITAGMRETRNILALNDSTKGPELRVSAQALLDHSQRHPPFRNAPNKGVLWAINILMAGTALYLSTFAAIRSFQTLTATDLLGLSLKAAAGYTAVYYTQAGINKLGERWQARKERRAHEWAEGRRNLPKSVLGLTGSGSSTCSEVLNKF